MRDRSLSGKIRYALTSPADEIWAEHVVRSERDVHIRKDPPAARSATAPLKCAHEISKYEAEARLVLRRR
jgi:hypothetical protein